MRTEPRDTTAIEEVEKRQIRRKIFPALGMIEAMKVTLRTMLSRAVTVHYPEERVELPPRTRGVIALLEENCTVCMLCAKECPCWCIYIEGHKEQKPGKRKPVNALDRFAIDYGLCMYCGICVEVCPFDALHWSPAFEYTAYSYEGMIHEADVLTSWQHHVLPPPPLVDDADEDSRQKVLEANAKRAEGIHAIIREPDKKAAYLAAQSASTQAPAPVAPQAATEAVAPAALRESSDTPPTAAVAEAADQVEAREVPAESPQPAAGAGNTFGLPKVDPMALPDGIGPVERGRLKKLAELQKRGTKPPDDLVANLKHLLDGMG